MKRRRPTQHWRRYRSGRHTFVNRGIKYTKKNFNSIPTHIKEEFKKLSSEDRKLMEETRELYISSFDNQELFKRGRDNKILRFLTMYFIPDVDEWPEEDDPIFQKDVNLNEAISWSLDIGMEPITHISGILGTKPKTKHELINDFKKAPEHKKMMIFDYIRKKEHGMGFLLGGNVSPSFKKIMDFFGSNQVRSKEDLEW